MTAGETILGIDLGTSNSVAAVWQGGAVRAIPNESGETLTPSVVAFPDSGEILIGEPARRQALNNPRNTISSIKRMMGCRGHEVDATTVPYEIVGGADEFVKVRVGRREYTPPEISAMILRHLKECAETYLGQRCEKAVVTVPAYFSDAQRQATKSAAEIAGLQVSQIINEPTAAALACGFVKSDEEELASVVVIHFGGGSFDVSVVEVSQVSPGASVVDVLSTTGDTQLGGDDIDKLIVGRVLEQLNPPRARWWASRKESNLSRLGDRVALQRLRQAAETAKRELSSSQTTEINLPHWIEEAGGVRDCRVEITRADLERLMAPLLERCANVLEWAISDISSPFRDRGDIAEVVLVGGSTRVPSVQELIRRTFNRSRIRGPYDSELVAAGAAIQGAILAGEFQDLLLMDVVPLSLGIETEGGAMTVLVKRNSKVPYKKTETFSTAADDQTAVAVRVFQGEHPTANDNRFLGEFNLEGIPPAPRGAPQIEVTFDIDVNGILSVSATDRATNRQQTVRVEGAGGLTSGEIARLRQEAETLFRRPNSRGAPSTEALGPH